MPTAEELRSLALAQPEVVEIETWGHPTFRVRDKIFATLSAEGDTCGIKTSKLEQLALVSSDPETFSVPAYVGRHGWVQVQLSRVAFDHLRELVSDAWRATAPKRLLREHDAAS